MIINVEQIQNLLLQRKVVVSPKREGPNNNQTPSVELTLREYERVFA
jgi:hypothetical protein